MPLLGSNNNLDVTITTQAQGSGVADTERQLQTLNQTADESTGKAGLLSSAFSDFANTVKTVGEAFIAYQLVSKVEDFFGSIISSAGGLEQTSIAFQAMIGNAQEANSVFGQLVQYANVTPFQAADIENAARTLMSFGTQGQQTVDIVKKIGDISSVSGANIGDLARVTGEVFSQGDFNARNMLELVHDGGGGLIKIMADNAGGMDKLRAKMQKGKVTANDFFAAVDQATSQGGYAFQGANREAQTFNGRLTTLRDAATMAGLSLIGVKLDPQLGLQIQPGGLFDLMKGGIAGITTALQDLQPKLQTVVPQFISGVQQLWDKIVNYLGPSFHALWNTVTTELLPALDHFWHQIIEPLIPVIGITLVGALYLVINGLNDLLKIASPVMDFLAGHTWVVWTLVGAFGALKAAMMLQQGFAAVQTGVAILTGSTFPAMIASISTTSAAWAAAFPVAGILADIALVATAISKVQGAFNAMQQAANAKVSAADQGGAITDIMNQYKAGKISKGQEQNAINALLKGVDAAVAQHATGGLNVGGLSVVGENGSELVALPQGSNIYTNAQSRAMLRGVTNNRTTHIGQVIINTPAAANQFFKNLDQDALNLSRGLSASRGMAA